MAQKVTLITGCSTGIGLDIAVKLGKDAAKKYMVYSTMRNLGKKEPLETAAGDALNDTICIRPLDVVKDDSVTNAVNEIVDKHGRIDLVSKSRSILLLLILLQLMIMIIIVTTTRVMMMTMILIFESCLALMGRCLQFLALHYHHTILVRHPLQRSIILRK